jgi:hypothetical protein
MGKEIKVKSSNMSTVEYDKKEKELIVKFTNDADTSYVYKGVEEDVFNNLLKAESKGSFFHKQIKTKYKWDKMKFRKEALILKKFLLSKGHKTIIIEKTYKGNGVIIFETMTPSGIFTVNQKGKISGEIEFKS